MEKKERAPKGTYNVCKEQFPPNGYYMDGYLRHNLNDLKGAIKKDWDFVLIVSGLEGAGKSVLAQQVGYYLDPTLTLDKIVFTPEEFEEAVKNAEKYTCIVWDEAILGTSAAETTTKVVRTVIKLLNMIRQKNLFIIIVLPSFFELTRYIAIHRSVMLLNIYAGKGLERGFFKAFDRDRKRMLYLKGKPFFNDNAYAPRFVGRFTNFYVVGEEAYRKKKDNILIEYNKEQKKSVKMRLSCPFCESGNVEYLRNKEMMFCRRCGEHYPRENTLTGGLSKVTT